MSNELPESDTAAPLPKRASRLSCGFQVAGVIALLLLGLLLIQPGTRRAGPTAKRTQCMNNLRNVMTALQSYASNSGSFPPAYTVDAQRRRLHSWRTLLLPYLDQEGLYHSIDFSKPWDDPANAHALAASIEIFQCPSAELPPNFTTYMANVGPHGVLRAGQSSRYADITDPTGLTIVLIDIPSEHAVHWMSPYDIDAQRLSRILKASKPNHSQGVMVGMADGSVRSLEMQSTSATKWRQMMIVDDGLPENF